MTQSTIKVLENIHTKNQRLEVDLRFLYYMLVYKIEEATNIEIYTTIFLEVWLLWCETGMLSLDPKWLPSKLIIKCTELNIKLKIKN